MSFKVVKNVSAVYELRSRSIRNKIIYQLIWKKEFLSVLSEIANTVLLVEKMEPKNVRIVPAMSGPTGWN